MLPRPWTRPHPPLWLACGSPSTFEKAGRLGMGALCFTMGEPEDLAPLIETYQNAIARVRRADGRVRQRERRLREHAAVPRGPRARASSCSATCDASHYQSLVVRWLDSIPLPVEIDRADVHACPSRPTTSCAASVDEGRRSLGAPEDVARSVERWQGAGADQLIFGMLDNTLPLEVAQESIEIFGRDVIPAFDSDPVHSTTRQREAQVGSAR